MRTVSRASKVRLMSAVEVLRLRDMVTFPSNVRVNHIVSVSHLRTFVSNPVRIFGFPALSFIVK